MQNFKQLRVWQKAHLLVLDVYAATALCPKAELLGLTAQMRRAAISVPANVVEAARAIATLEAEGWKLEADS